MTLPKHLRWLDTFALWIVAPGAVALIALLGVSMLLHTVVLEREGQRGAAELAAFRILPAVVALSSIPAEERQRMAQAMSGGDIEMDWGLSARISGSKMISRELMPFSIFNDNIIDLKAVLRQIDSRYKAIQEVDLSVQLRDQSWLNARVRAVSLLSADDLTYRLASFAVGAGLLILAAYATQVVARPLARLASRARDLPADGVLQVNGIGGPREVREVAEALQAATSKAQELLQQRSFALGALSHDLVSPLARLKLRAHDISEPALRKRVLSDVDEMLDMVGDVLAYLRGADGGGEARVAMSLSALVQVIVDEFGEDGHPVQERQLHDISVHGQPVALKRALRNLVVNAVKYGRDPWVEVVRRTHDAIVRIGDSGDGMAAADLARVFEPFYRGDFARAYGEGSGLGLPTAKAILEAHGGNLTLSSKLGIGTIAEVTLPLSVDRRLGSVGNDRLTISPD